MNEVLVLVSIAALTIVTTKERGDMIRHQQPALSLLAIGLIGMGTLSIISRDLAFGWQPVPQFHPGREALALVCGLFMITVSVALLFRDTVALASRALFLKSG